MIHYTSISIFRLRQVVLLWSTLCLFIFSSCNALRFVPENEKLYTGASIDLNSEEAIKGDKVLEDKIENVIGPEPNSKFLGMRVGLWAHYKTSRGDSGLIPRFLNRKYGEEPVYLSDVNIESTEKLILNRCENSGFFYSRVISTVKEKKRTASVNYDISISRPYRLASYVYERDSLYIDSVIRRSLPETELTPGTRFDLEELTAERDRINDYLKDHGFYQFNSNYLVFTTDTNQYKERKFDLYLSFKSGVPQKTQIPYKLDQVVVYPNYSVKTSNMAPTDSLRIDDIEFVQDTVIFKHWLLRDYITFQPGYLYSDDRDQNTIRRLSNIGTYQLVSTRYKVLDSLTTDSLGYLKASILLSPAKKNNLRVEVQGFTKSTSFTGPGLITSYRNKNFFGGGELLDISGNISYETQLYRGSSQGLSSFQFKLSNSLTIPRLIAPFSIDPQKAFSIPKTKFAFNYTLQDRAQYYKLNSFLFTYGYTWNSNRFIFQEVTPLSLNYTIVSQKTPEFISILENNPFLARSFESQFIPAINYTFQYSEIGEPDKIHQVYFNFNADLAGNITSTVQNLFGMDSELFGLPYAQYAKGDVDFRYYLNTGKKSKLVTRLFAGVGYPYGNSTSLPYIKQYFSGGPNSVRAFRVRSLGPGSYRPDDSNNRLSFFDQSGDIRFEANIEYRFPMISILKGALFADMGNIWLMNENPAIPGGKFSSDWPQELALGTGYGLRLDIKVLIIRLDVSFPLRYNAPVDGNYWQQFDFNSGGWFYNNLVWNFAIGYPF